MVESWDALTSSWHLITTDSVSLFLFNHMLLLHSLLLLFLFADNNQLCHWAGTGVRHIYSIKQGRVCFHSSCPSCQLGLFCIIITYNTVAWKETTEKQKSSRSKCTSKWRCSHMWPGRQRHTTWVANNCPWRLIKDQWDTASKKAPGEVREGWIRES